MFDKNFISKNIKNCYLIINGKKKELSEYYIIDKNENQDRKLEIKLIEINPIKNMSNMFYECSSLESLSEISNWDTKKVTNISEMFAGCISLESLPGISQLNTKNVNNMVCFINVHP